MTSSWRASMRASSRASGPSKLSSRTWVAASGRRPAPNTTAGPVRVAHRRTSSPTRSPRPSARLVREPEPLAGIRVDGLLLVADQVDGPLACSRPHEPARPRRRRGRGAARSRRAIRARAPRRRQIHVPYRVPSEYATRGPRPVSPFAQSWRSPATSTSRSVMPPSRRCATTSRPCRRSATCIASNRASSDGRSQETSCVPLRRIHPGPDVGERPGGSCRPTSRPPGDR